MKSRYGTNSHSLLGEGLFMQGKVSISSHQSPPSSTVQTSFSPTSERALSKRLQRLGSTRLLRRAASAGRGWVNLIRRSGSLPGWAGNPESGVCRASCLWFAAIAQLLSAIGSQIQPVYDQTEDFTDTHVSAKYMHSEVHTNPKTLFQKNPNNEESALCVALFKPSIIRTDGRFNRDS